MDKSTLTTTWQLITLDHWLKKIVNKYSDKPLTELAYEEGKDDDNYDNDGSTSPITPTTRKDIDEAMEKLIKLSLLTDVEFDPLPLKLASKTT